jgi:PAS domain S-box-containing protein
MNSPQTLLPKIPTFRGLSARFLLVLVPVFLVVSLSGLFYLSRIDQSGQADALAARVGIQAARVAGAMGRYGDSMDPGIVDVLLASLLSDRALLCAEVREPETGKVLASRPPVVGCRNAGTGEILRLPVGRDGKRVLHVVVSDRELVESAESRLALIFAVLAIAFVISIGVALAAFRWIVGARLGRLRRAIHETAETGLRGPVDVSGDDELSDIIRAFNRMQERETERESEFESINSRISDLNRTLEQRIEERTAELAKSEGRLRELIESFSSGIYIHADFEPLYANGKLLEMLGYDDLDDFCSMGSTRFVLAPEERERIWGYHRARLKGEPAPTSYDFQALKKSGERLLVNNRSFPVVWNGRRAVCTTLFDLTEQKSIEDSLAEQRHLLESLLATTEEGFWFVNTNGRTTDLNPAMCRILGRDRDEVIGKSIFEFVDEENDSIFREQIERRKQGVRGAYEISLLRPDGTNIPCINNATPLYTPSGERVGSVGIWTDISAMKDVQQRLETEMAKAQAANIAKSEFLAVSSHELRTPMNGILGMAGLLRGTQLTDEQRRRLDVIEQSGETLLSVLNDILDISKIEAGHVVLETRRFDLPDLIDGVRTLLQPRAEENGLTLSSDIGDSVPDAILADPTRLRQVLINLIGNAIKFTETGRIDVEVTNESPADAEAENVLLRFEVRDTGIGIEPDEQRRIFEKFTQADSSTTRKFGGTGLGLAICQDLGSLLGGEIGVESEPGVGSTFWFTVDCKRAGKEASSDAATASSDHHPLDNRPGQRLDRPLEILVAEDNAVNQIVAVEYIESAGHTSEVAETGRAAVEAAESKRFDLILMDFQMPEMDGFDATRLIRKRETEKGLAPVRIVAVTANAFREDREACLRAGMNDFLSKPYTVEQFRDMLEKAQADVKERNASEPACAADPSVGNVIAFKAESGLQAAVVKPLRDGKPDLWKRLVVAYLRATPENIDALERGLADEDCAAVQIAAHTLKSSSANMGAVRLSELNRAVEQLAADKNLNQTELLLTEIKREFGIVASELSADSNESCKQKGAVF